jgi:hypothetical protein
MAEGVESTDWATWTALMDDPDNQRITFEVVERTDRVWEIKVTECLMAKTFREAGAADIGYAVQCSGDPALCRGFNPKIRQLRTKTLMQGDDCCNHRWVWEERSLGTRGGRD